MSGFNFAKFNENLKEFGQNLGSNIQSIGSNIQPVAQRTTRLVQEKLGNADDVSQLPQEYIELEKKIDALKDVHQKLLSVTDQYENESYDYPPNLKESFIDFSKTVSGKVQGLSHVSSAQEAQAVLTSPAPKAPPKTLNHALGRAALSASSELSASSAESLATALEKYALAEQRIGDARLSQDKLINQRVNAPLRNALKESFAAAAAARKNVANKRLSYDAARAYAKNAKPEKQAAARVAMETAEDEFASATEDAVAIMRSVIDNTSTLQAVVELIVAQLAFHKAAYETLATLLPEVEKLKEEETAASIEGDDI